MEGQSYVRRTDGPAVLDPFFLSSRIFCEVSAWRITSINASCDSHKRRKEYRRSVHITVLIFAVFRSSFPPKPSLSYLRPSVHQPYSIVMFRTFVSEGVLSRGFLFACRSCCLFRWPRRRFGLVWFGLAIQRCICHCLFRQTDLLSHNNNIGFLLRVCG